MMAKKCPFLKEAQVGSCQVSPVRKLIRRSSIHEQDQRCSTPAYVDCPACQGRLNGRRDLPSCPFLDVSLVQYCEAASVTKFIPYNDDLLSRCNSDAHRYCQLYLQRIHPGQHPAPVSDEVPAPENLAYVRNHMWLDEGPDGSWHVGVDAFLGRVLGEIEHVSVISGNGYERPTVALTVRGIDLILAFPQSLRITGANALTRQDPQVLVTDPYETGWIFEGIAAEAKAPNTPHKNNCDLIRGADAVSWMRQETNRMTEFVHDLLARRHHQEECLMNDGGTFASDLAKHLDREELLSLFSRFFTP